MGAFFSGGKGWITEPRRFSAWFGCPPKAAAFAKLLPIDFRRRKAGSEPPPHIRTSKRRPFSVVGRGGFTNHGALARGSAVRRRRQLSRSCCQSAFEDEKREANLHPLTKGTKFMVPAFCAEKGWIYEPRRFSAWFGCPPKASAFAKLLPTGSRRRKAGSEPPPHIRTSKRRPFSVVGRGGLTNHGALARGSAVRRRRQLSRSCCQPAFEDEKPKTIISI